MKIKLHHILLLALLLCLLPSGTQAQNDRQLIRQGNRLYRQQNYAKAEIEYRKAIGKNGQNPQALYNLGCALMMQQKDSAAVVQYESAAKLETSKIRKAKIFHNIGVVCQTHQMYGEAIQAYKESLRNNPNDNETRYNLALCKRLEKKQKQNAGGKGRKDRNSDKNKDQNQDQNKNQKNKDQQDKEREQQPKDQMSKENAERLLNAAVQEEKATQQHLKKALQQPNRRQLQRNW